MSNAQGRCVRASGMVTKGRNLRCCGVSISFEYCASLASAAHDLLTDTSVNASAYCASFRTNFRS
eukprot:76323-Pyramimonas_sp.AAC.1